MNTGVKFQNLPQIIADEVSGTDEFVVLHTADGQAKKLKLSLVSGFVQEQFADNNVLQGKFPPGSLTDLSIKFDGYTDTGFYLSDPPNGIITFVSGGEPIFSFNQLGLQVDQLNVTDVTMSGSINNALAIGQQSSNKDYSFEPRELFHLSSPDAARLLIEADVNNVDEYANAQILLEQDGGTVQGHLGFWDGTNSLYILNKFTEDVVIGTNNQEEIRVDGSSGNVGIGDWALNAPPQKLSVRGDISIYEQVVCKGNINTAFRFPDHATASIRTGRQDRLFVAENGNVGIKTTKPSVDFEVNGTSKADIRVYKPHALPSNPVEGMTYYNEQYKTLFLFNGDKWEGIGKITDYTGFKWDASTASPAAVPGGPTPPVSTPVHDRIRACVLLDTGQVNYYLNPSDWSKKLLGDDADLSGVDGNVMIEIPAFYYREDVNGVLRTPEISLDPVPGFTLHPAFMKDGVQVSHRYYGAYDACVYSASEAGYINGLNLDDNSSRVDLGTDKLASVKGYYPMVGLTRDQFRQLAANVGEGWRQVDYDLVAAVQLLYAIEYQTFFSQSVLGAGNTNSSYKSSSANQDDSPNTISGAGDSIGTGSTDATSGKGVSSYPGVSFMKYRGIENFFGNVWNWADGINVNVGETGTVYVTNDSKYFADNTSQGMNLVSSALPTSSGYISQLQLASPYFLPQSTSGGSSTTYVTDYQYASASSNRVVHVGGGADIAARAGAFGLNSGNGSSIRNRSVGARLAF